MTSIRARIDAAAFAILEAAARWAPRKLLAGAGAVAGSLAQLYYADYTRTAKENLRLAYGDSITERDARRIVRRCWRHFGRIIFDALGLHRYTADSVGSDVHYEGLEHVRSAYARGRGVLLFSAHYGHWELSALMQGRLGMRLAIVTRPLDNPMLEQRVARLRTSSGNLIVYKRHGVREALQLLRSGAGVAVVIDQDARDRGVFVPFFGRPASTTRLLALLALRTGAPVVPVFSIPLSDGSYKVVYEPELNVQRSGNLEEDVVGLTAECTAIVERWVRSNPHLWLWMHRRWKTRPPGLLEAPQRTRVHGVTVPGGQRVKVER